MQSPCDGHVGVIKRLIKREVRKNQILDDETDLIDLFKICVPHAETIYLDVERILSLDCDKMENGIKKFFSFSFSGPGIVNCFEKTGDSQLKVQQILEFSPEMIPAHPKQLQTPKYPPSKPKTPKTPKTPIPKLPKPHFPILLRNSGRISNLSPNF